MARKSQVLLKNESRTLPLNKRANIALIGPLADSKIDMLGSWSGAGVPAQSVTVLEGLRAAVGKPGTLTLSILPSIRTVPAPGSGRGCAWKLALKTFAYRAVALRAGILSANSPSSGTHSCRHISHCAFSLISKSPPRSEGLNCGVTVSGTGKSTVPL